MPSATKKTKTQTESATKKTKTQTESGAGTTASSSDSKASPPPIPPRANKPPAFPTSLPRHLADPGPAISSPVKAASVSSPVPSSSSPNSSFADMQPVLKTITVAGLGVYLDVFSDVRLHGPRSTATVPREKLETVCTLLLAAKRKDKRCMLALRAFMHRIFSRPLCTAAATTPGADIYAQLPKERQWWWLPTYILVPRVTSQNTHKKPILAVRVALDSAKIAMAATGKGGTRVGTKARATPSVLGKTKPSADSNHGNIDGNERHEAKARPPDKAMVDVYAQIGDISLEISASQFECLTVTLAALSRGRKYAKYRRCTSAINSEDEEHTLAVAFRLLIAELYSKIRRQTSFFVFLLLLIVRLDVLLELVAYGIL